MAEIGHPTSPSSLDLLSVALTTRAETVAELAGVALRDEDTVRSELEELERAGYLSVTGQSISYRMPEQALADRAQSLLEQASTNLDEQLGEVKQLLAAIPRLVASWSEGMVHVEGARPEIFHGAFAPTDLWLRVAAARRIRSTDGMLPDASRIFAADPRAQKIWFEAISDENLHVRTLLSSADVTLPGAAEVITADMAIGAEFRMLPDPPSWIWIADDDTVGLPLRWGEAWPTSVMAVRDPAVVTLARWVYDRLWEEAVPVFAPSSNWDSLLGLMNRGATLEAASHALGISARTGRRRVAAAIEHFGVDGLFALGAAWQRSTAAGP